MNVALLRLSALGDVANCLCLANLISKKKDVKLTWFVGKAEYELVKKVPNIDFEVVDKKQSIKELFRLKKKYKNQVFDSILYAQRSLRCSLIAKGLNGKRRIGFDPPRAKELQSFFTSESISTPKSPHAVDAFLEFAYSLKASQQKNITWDFGPISAPGSPLKPENSKYFCINLSGSDADRDWPISRFKEVTEKILAKKNWAAVLIGGPSEREKERGKKLSELLSSSDRVLNQVGKTSIQELLSLLSQSQLLISPDSGPVHIASALNIPVVGLYVHMPLEITGPYNNSKFCIDKYAEALKLYYKQKKKIDLNTGIPKRIKAKGAMNLIQVQDVIQKVDLVIDSIP